MISARSLHYPRWRSLINHGRRLSPTGRAKLATGALFVVAVWVGLSLGLIYLLNTLYQIELLGPYMADRLLSLLLLSFTGVLLLSNIITSLATFYLSDELMLINAAPVSSLRLFYARFVENLVASSWMVGVFGVPVVLAYGWVHGAGLLFFGVSAIAAIGFLLVPACVGVVTTTLLVNIFPARAARDLFIVITAIFLGGAWILFRVLRPERLVNPEGFGGVAEFLSSLSVPQQSFLPSSWAAAAMQAALRGQTSLALSKVGFLTLWGLAFVVLAAWITSRLYLGGWSRAQEGRPARLRGLAGTGLQRLGTALLGRAGGAILAKDAKVLVRDATQWSQMVLLVAMVAIYLFSIYALPFETLQFDTGPYRNFVAFLNIGMTGFVQAAVAARFVYPSVSAEGRGIWILRSAPASARELVRAKWLIGALPVLVFGEVLAVASNVILKTDLTTRWVAVADAALCAGVICALAAGMGAMMPNFKAENAVKVAASFGGLLYMSASVAFLSVLIAAQAYPTWRLLAAQHYGRALGPSFGLAAALGYGGSLILALLLLRTVLRHGARSLELREY